MPAELRRHQGPRLKGPAPGRSMEPCVHPPGAHRLLALSGAPPSSAGRLPRTLQSSPRPVKIGTSGGRPIIAADHQKEPTTTGTDPEGILPKNTVASPAVGTAAPGSAAEHKSGCAKKATRVTFSQGFKEGSPLRPGNSAQEQLPSHQQSIGDQALGTLPLTITIR
ncbi:hypothetical protein MRX96_040382 [Rhipicephalus microplus]